jgi:hypothetical protein
MQRIYTVKDVDDIVNRMYTDEEVEVYGSDDDNVMLRVSEALVSGDVRVQTLDLRDGLRLGGAQSLRDALQQQKNLILTELWLCPTIQKGSLEILSKGLASIKNLLLCDCEIHIDDYRALAGALRTSRLEMLSLERNHHLGNSGAAALAEAIAHCAHLVKLSLHHCSIGSLGAAAIGESLVTNKTLQELYLSDNVIGDRGATALAKGLASNKTLTLLHLRWCGIRKAGAISLAQSLRKNAHLEQLDLWGNMHIQPEGVTALAEGLACNTSLSELHLPDVDNPPQKEKIRLLLEANRFRQRYLAHFVDDIPPYLWPLLYARVSLHSAALYVCLRENEKIFEYNM